MYKITKNAKKLKKIDLRIVKRIVMFLRNNNNVKRTNLAMNCKMSYDKSALYLDWLNETGLIDKEEDEKGFELIRLSNKGREFYDLIKDSGNDLTI